MNPLAAPALVAAAVVTSLVVLLLLSVAAAHLVRTRRSARQARRRAELTPLVHALLDDDPAELVMGPDVAGAPAVFDELVLGLLPQLRGADRQVLQQLLAERGVVARAAADLTARAAWRRGRAAALLGSTAGAQHTAALAALLADRSADVRCAAARGLGKTGDPSAARSLMAALTSTPPLPHGVIGMAVLDLGTAALPVLRSALTDDAVPPRVLAAELLGLHGDLAAVPALLEALADRSQPTSVRRSAAGALGRIGAPQATDALVRVLSYAPTPALQHAAAEALGRIGDPDAAAALGAGLASAAPEVAGACADALVALGPEGRVVLETATGAAGGAARAALDAAALGPRRPQPVAR